MVQLQFLEKKENGLNQKKCEKHLGLTHGPYRLVCSSAGSCKLTLNVKEGVMQEALVETIGCSGMTHSAAMASEILPGKTVLEALNTDLVCDAINTAMRGIVLANRLRTYSVCFL